MYKHPKSKYHHRHPHSGHSFCRSEAAFTKRFHDFSTIIPSTILLQANPDAPNSSKRGRIVEEL
jgi:hypothetical protein